MIDAWELRLRLLRARVRSIVASLPRQIQSLSPFVQSSRRTATRWRRNGQHHCSFFSPFSWWRRQQAKKSLPRYQTFLALLLLKWTKICVFICIFNLCLQRTGWGTDEKTVIEVLSHRHAAQRVAIAEAYTRVYGESLLERLHSELSGDFRVTSPTPSNM